eukprot:Rmarinus@m.8193
MRYKVFIGVRFAEGLSDDEWQNTYDEVEHLSTYFQFSIMGEHIVRKVEFQFAKHPKSIYQVKDRFHWLTTDKVLIVKFSAPKKIAAYAVTSSFVKRLRDLILAISIAKKGGIDIGGRPVIFIDNQYFEELRPFIHSLDLAAQKAA